MDLFERFGSLLLKSYGFLADRFDCSSTWPLNHDRDKNVSETYTSDVYDSEPCGLAFVIERFKRGRLLSKRDLRENHSKKIKRRTVHKVICAGIYFWTVKNKWNIVRPQLYSVGLNKPVCITSMCLKLRPNNVIELILFNYYGFNYSKMFFLLTIHDM